jgi:hypothetical protein
MTMTTNLLPAARELTSRTGDGIDVRLLWCEADDLLFVTVDDHRTGESFTVPVPVDQRPLEVFQHPYAYSA